MPSSYIDVVNISRSPVKSSEKTINTAMFEWTHTRTLKIIYSHKGKTRTGITNIHVLGCNYPIYQAKDAVFDFSNMVYSQYASNGKYVTPIDSFDSIINSSDVHVPKSGFYTLRMRYANGMSSTSNQKLIINGIAGNIAYPMTVGWEVFHNTIQIVYLNRANNAMKLMIGKEENVGVDNFPIMVMDTYNDDFVDNRNLADARGWIPYSVGWYVDGGRYSVSKGNGFKTMLSYRENGNFTHCKNVKFSSDVMVKVKGGKGGIYS
ncbi:MAG: hypothetical protein ACI9YE_001349 [Psychroserpens sp.]